MKNAFFLILSFLFSLTVAGQQDQTVNALLHDESYYATFGTNPGSKTSEQAGIVTHLLYVEQLLRNNHNPNLTNQQQRNRLAILDILHEYILAGQFPVNRDYPGERRPCFIDANGNICAVGYLVEKTAGRNVAIAINERHQYDYVLDMDEPVLDNWVKEFGLTLEECAMIQPAYGPPPPPETIHAEIKTSYGVSSGVLGGTNIAISAANITGNWRNSKTLSYIGLASGASQLVLGLANIKKTSITPLINGGEIQTSYKSQNSLSYANIAVGTTTIVSSIINLARQKKNSDMRTAWGVYSFPNQNNSVTMRVSVSRRI